MTGGEPGRVAGLEKHAAAVLAYEGLPASIVLAVALIVIAVGPGARRSRADGPRAMAVGQAEGNDGLRYARSHANGWTAPRNATLTFSQRGGPSCVRGFLLAQARIVAREYAGER
jgi:hypothetical protein